MTGLEELAPTVTIRFWAAGNACLSLTLAMVTRDPAEKRELETANPLILSPTQTKVVINHLHSAFHLYLATQSLTSLLLGTKHTASSSGKVK